mgnify:CR=1 FL=1
MINGDRITTKFVVIAMIFLALLLAFSCTSTVSNSSHSKLVEQIEQEKPSLQIRSRDRLQVSGDTVYLGNTFYMKDPETNLCFMMRFESASYVKKLMGKEAIACVPCDSLTNVNLYTLERTNQ